MVSIDVLKLYDLKELGEETVYFVLRFWVYH